MRKIVFFTGAGMSKESGLPTFRGDGGIWNELDVEAVASARSWYCGRRRDCKERRQVMLDFFNPIRRSIMEHEPNAGHRIIAEFEGCFNITVITQNGDDYHERAGSSKVIHIHGEALKNTSSANPYNPIPIDYDSPDINIGDKAPDGSQIRPFVIFFDENIDRNLWNDAVRECREADYFVVVGSSMVVFPAADLIKKIKHDCQLVVIDPSDVELPGNCNKAFTHIKCIASVGLNRLKERLIKQGDKDIS